MEKDFILVVDDKEENRAAAQAYLHSAGLDGVVASDYVEAKAVLDSGAHIDGVITDCFFPEETGSGRKDLGRQTIEHILAGAYGGKLEQAAGIKSKEESIDDALTTFGQVVTLGDSPDDRLSFLLHNYLAYCVKDEEYNPEEDRLLNSIRHMSGSFGPDKAAEHLLETLASASIYDEAPHTNVRQYDELHYVSRMSYGLRKPLEVSESDQPLGVVVAEEAAARGIPTIIVSSAYHHATNMQPIGDYIGKRREEAESAGKRLGWEIMADMDPSLSSQQIGKDNPRAWASAYEGLLLEAHLPAGDEGWQKYHRRKEALQKGETLSLRALREAE